MQRASSGGQVAAATTASAAISVGVAGGVAAAASAGGGVGVGGGGGAIAAATAAAALMGPVTQHPSQMQGGLGSLQGPPRSCKISPIKNADEAADHVMQKVSNSLCVGCGGLIHDQYILMVSPDLKWHAACLKCAACQQFLDESCTCFVRDGKTYCKNDYVRLFGTKCEKCRQSFKKNDFVMRASTKIYHMECFCCVACGRHLTTGDEYALRANGLYCRHDHCTLAGDKSGCQEPILASGGAAAPLHHHHHHPHHHHHHLGAGGPLSISNENNNNANLTNNNHHLHQNDASLSDSESESGSHKTVGGGGGGGGGGNSGGGGGGGGRGGGHKGSGAGAGSDGKPTRVRTVLNEKQLHTLRSCYSANPRPDALMREQLVEMTGLSPRVIRVWFQNKRCKDKKKTIALKQQMQQEKDGRKLGFGGMHGIPMVASSPVRHESPIGMPLEVQAYQPPWKALSGFALHTDLERLDPNAPPFHHLVSQMHGYDLHGGGGGPAQLPPPGMMGGGGGGPMGGGDVGGGGPLGPPVPQMHQNGPGPDMGQHPDSTDSYVTYLESDSDSLQHDNGSP